MMLQNFFHTVLPQAVANISILSFILVYFGGILTSASPCCLTMIPVTVGYIGGYNEGSGDDGGSRLRGFTMSLIFVLGLSTTFALFGIIAVMLGKIFGQLGTTWYYVIAALAIVMGLNLLGVININFPGLKELPIKKSGLLPAYLIGMLFGLVMSPCATPVLAVIVTYVASTGSFYYGAALLFVYGLGHGLPLILAGTFTATIKQLPRFRSVSRYVTTVSGVIMILLGLYFLILVRWY